jgi:hypothetical protein
LLRVGAVGELSPVLGLDLFEGHCRIVEHSQLKRAAGGNDLFLPIGFQGGGASAPVTGLSGCVASPSRGRWCAPEARALSASRAGSSHPCRSCDLSKLTLRRVFKTDQGWVMEAGGFGSDLLRTAVPCSLACFGAQSHADYEPTGSMVLQSWRAWLG